MEDWGDLWYGLVVWIDHLFLKIGYKKCAGLGCR
jgi:hypothetical protein